MKKENIVVLFYNCNRDFLPINYMSFIVIMKLFWLQREKITRIERNQFLSLIDNSILFTFLGV